MDVGRKVEQKENDETKARTSSKIKNQEKEKKIKSTRGSQIDEKKSEIY
jgi:hypothetical protein